MAGLLELTNALWNGTIPDLLYHNGPGYGLLFPKIWGLQPHPIITGEATDFKFGRYIHNKAADYHDLLPRNQSQHTGNSTPLKRSCCAHCPTY